MTRSYQVMGDDNRPKVLIDVIPRGPEIGVSFSRDGERQTFTQREAIQTLAALAQAVALVANYNAPQEGG